MITDFLFWRLAALDAMIKKTCLSWERDGVASRGTVVERDTTRPLIYREHQWGLSSSAWDCQMACCLWFGEIILKLQITSSSAREISSRCFAQLSRKVRVFVLVRTHRTKSGIFCKLAQYILGWLSRTKYPATCNCNFGWWRRKLTG